MTELKPCPFCGGEAVIKTTCVEYCYLKCQTCGAETEDNFKDTRAGREQAKDAWNHRAEDVELQKYHQAEAEGRLVVLPCKPDGAYWHRNYDTGQLELNFEMHSLGEHDDTYPEYDRCAYWE